MQEIDRIRQRRYHMLQRAGGCVCLAETSGSLKIHKMLSLSTDADLTLAFSNVDAVIHLADLAHVMHDTAASPLDEL